MAIAKNPKRNTSANKEKEAEAFISGANGTNTNSTSQGANQNANQTEIETPDENKKPITLRIDPDILKRVDRAAKRLGISRSAFMVSSAAEKLERME